MLDTPLEALELSRREAGWIALAADRVAFAPDDDRGWQRLQREAWLLARWRAAAIPAPRVLLDAPSHRVQVRERLGGLSGHDLHTEADHSPLFTGTLPDVHARLDDAPLSAFGETLAASYGELAARIRRAVTVADARAAGLDRTSRGTLDVDAAIARLDASTASPAAKRAAHAARDWLVALPPPDAVIHADLHFFNLCAAPDGTISGVFDVGDAGIDSAATELMYVHSLGSRFARIAMAAYGPIDLDQVRQAHLRTALDHLIWHGPGTPRHASIVAWATAAFERLA